MKIATALVVLFMASFALAPATRADTISYVIIGPNGLDDCTFSGRPGTYYIFATLNLSAPAAALEFSAPVWCGGPGIAWQVPVSGDPNTVLTADLGGCISGSVQLFTATFDVTAYCCPALIQGPAPSGWEVSPPVLIGCDGERRFVAAQCSASEPLLLTPPDGGTDVSLTPFLSWHYAYAEYCMEGIGLAIFTILYGTDPENLDQSVGTLDATEWTLPRLEPYTEYFWRVKVWDDFAPLAGAKINYSEVRSFRTLGPIAVEEKTWGAVKALFEE